MSRGLVAKSKIPRMPWDLMAIGKDSKAELDQHTLYGFCLISRLASLLFDLPRVH